MVVIVNFRETLKQVAKCEI